MKIGIQAFLHPTTYRKLLQANAKTNGISLCRIFVVRTISKSRYAMQRLEKNRLFSFFKSL